MQELESCKEGDVGQKKRSIVSMIRGSWLIDKELVGEAITSKMAERDIIIGSLAKIVDIISLKDLNVQGTASFYMNREAESKCGSIFVRRSLYVLSCKDLSDISMFVTKER